MISFESIPSSIRKPDKLFEFNNKLAVRTLPANRQKLLLIGQMLSAGATAAEKTPTDIFSDAQAASCFGAGSIAHLMVRAAITANPYVALTVVGLKDATGSPVAATGTITPAAATAAGTLRVWIGYQYVDVGVASGDAAAVIATAIAAAVNARADLPVTASVATASVTLTAKNKGTVGNAIALNCEATNGCVSTTVAAMASGATDPVMADALTPVFGAQYDVIASQFNDTTSLGSFRTHLNTVSGPMEQRRGVGIFGFTGTLANATTLATGLNSGRLVAAYLRNTRSLPCELAAAFASVVAGEEDPAKPFNTLALSGIHAPTVSDRLSRTEQESCLYNGLTPLEVNASGVPAIVRAITTYIKDASNNPDISLLDLTTIRTLDYVRAACRSRISLRFPRAKLNANTIKSVRSELLDVLTKLEDLEIVQAVSANADGLVVERSGTDPNRLDAKIPCDVVNGLHVFAGRIDLIL